jgi:NTE family protein
VGPSLGRRRRRVLGRTAPVSGRAAYASDRPLSPEGEQLFQAFGPRQRDFPPFDFGAIVRGWRAPSPAAALRALRRPWELRPTAAAITVLPAGRVDITEHTSVLDSVLDAQLDDESGWPVGLRVCALRRSDGRRVVFGRPGAPTASLGEAVAASCAIPGYFAPVRIDGRAYVDGGAHSPTNADVLSRDHLDLVVVVSPMSAKRGRARTPDGLVRLAAHRALRREVAQLRAAGTEVLCFEPEPGALSVMGLNPMAEDRSGAVVDAAADETRRRLVDPRLAVRLDRLGGRRCSRRVA